jgi:uncharacterized membrane protein YbhN (UPF0104 family)
MSEAGKKSNLWNYIKIALAIILIVFVIRQVSLQDILAIREQVVWGWLVVSFVFFCLMTVFKALQYYVLLGKPVPYQRVLSIVITQNAISNFIANSAGVISFITLIHKDDGVRIRKATAALLITKLGDLFSAWLFLLMTSFILWTEAESLRSLIVFLLIIIVVGFLGFGIVLLWREHFVDLLRRIATALGLSRFRLFIRLFELVELIAAQERTYLFSLLSKSIFYSFVYYILTLAWSFATIYAFSIPIGFWPFIFITTLMQLISIIPVQVFGGLGVNETVNMYLFNLFGILRSQIVPALLGMRVLFYLMNALILAYFPIRFIMGKLAPSPADSGRNL